MGGIEGRGWRQGAPDTLYTQSRSATETGDRFAKIYGDTVMSGLKTLITGSPSDALQSAGQTLVGGLLSSSSTKIPTGTQWYGNNTAGIRQQTMVRNRGSIPGRKNRK